MESRRVRASENFPRGPFELRGVASNRGDMNLDSQHDSLMFLPTALLREDRPARA